MRKIQTMFVRDPESLKRVTREVDPDCQWVLDGEGVATEKFDGTACCVWGGKLYRRHKLKEGAHVDGWVHWRKPAMLGDGPESGHGWLPVLATDTSSRYHLEAWDTYDDLFEGTYELVGPKFQKNPHKLERHELWQHGSHQLTEFPRSFDGIRAFLEAAPPMEGIVFHHPDGRMAKIKRRDFGLPWPA